MDPKNQPKQRQRRRSHAVDLLALDAGGAGGGGRRVRQATASPEGPESLTRKFNRAAKKPHFVPRNDKERELVLSLRRAIKEVTQPANDNRFEKPVSRQEVDRLTKLLKQPTMQHHLTPKGMAKHTYDLKQQRKIAREINRQVQVLNQHRGKAKHQFNKASGISM